MSNTEKDIINLKLVDLMDAAVNMANTIASDITRNKAKISDKTVEAVAKFSMLHNEINKLLDKETINLQ